MVSFLVQSTSDNSLLPKERNHVKVNLSNCLDVEYRSVGMTDFGIYAPLVYKCAF